MATSDNDKLAVLIDADNAQTAIIHELLAEVSRYGTASVKRAYGDWTTTNLKGWKDVLSSPGGASCCALTRGRSTGFSADPRAEKPACSAPPSALRFLTRDQTTGRSGQLQHPYVKRIQRPSDGMRAAVTTNSK